ncbi:heat shock protein 70 family protein [Kipferlia bialata]|uniref:Heat shock protein 70 family protein n=1 Tax=Kipferlia bialata TaxID=797122 RepID=A0A9K3CVX9_9EUKA|nr:heat shock protein 70 family protein [Kipferlia bialata]|eukprot:g4374.t1
MTVDNNNLGRFDLTEIPPAPRGVPQVEVTFDIDANGILTVSAADKGTGNENQIVIKNERGRISEDEVKRLIEEASLFEEKDALLRLRIEARNALESYAYQTRQMLYDEDKLTEQLTEQERETIEAAIEGAIEYVEEHFEDGTTEEFEEARKEMEDVVYPIISRVYGAAAEGYGEEEEEFDFDGFGDL